MWFGLTIARSSPASTQWCRKTELSTERAGRPTPNETLETPSEVRTPGRCSLMRRMPSIVSTADGRHSSSPVVSVNVSVSKISSCGSRPCSSQTSWWIRCATSSLRSRVLAIPTSSMVSAISAAPWASAIGATRSSLSRPASRLIELTIARPLDHVGLGRVDLDRCGLRERDLLGHEPHLLVLVLALGQRDAEVEHVGAAFDLVLGDLQQAVVVIGEQQLLR